ncbi:MAG: LamG-like jellyroll fold domain-containing protein [Merdibacter sp.]
MWVKAGDTVGTNAVLVSSSVSEIKLDQWNKTGKVGITEAGVADYTFDYSAPKGEWVHLTFVGDSNGTTLYVNGEEQDHLDATIDGPMYRLGASSGSSITGYLNGSLDDVRFYTRALSADEVAEIAQVSTDDETASEAAIAALQTMVDKAVALGSDDAALNEAITNAQAVLAKEAPTATEVVTALLDLSEAMQALNTDESTDALRADVQATIDFINENILNDVEGLRPGKVQALRDAVQAAQDVVNDPDATADELQAANKAMTKAAQELWEIVTKAELEALIEAANGYLDGDYTAESLEALQVAITAAQAVAENDDATTAEVTEAITNLSNTIAGLVEEAGVDKSALAYEIELVNEMLTNIDNYVPSSVEGLADKLASAQQVYDDVNAAQDAVDAATQALREARLNARTKADVSALEELIAYANSLDLSGYSRASVAVLNQAIAQNKLLLSDPEVSQDKVDAAVTEIQNAIDALEPVSETAGSTTADSTNTAAASTMGMMAALMAAAGAAAVMAYRRKRS